MRGACAPSCARLHHTPRRLRPPPRPPAPPRPPPPLSIGRLRALDDFEGFGVADKADQNARHRPATCGRTRWRRRRRRSQPVCTRPSAQVYRAVRAYHQPDNLTGGLWGTVYDGRRAAWQSRRSLIQTNSNATAAASDLASQIGQRVEGRMVALRPSVHKQLGRGEGGGSKCNGPQTLCAG